MSSDDAVRTAFRSEYSYQKGDIPIGIILFLENRVLDVNEHTAAMARVSAFRLIGMDRGKLLTSEGPISPSIQSPWPWTEIATHRSNLHSPSGRSVNVLTCEESRELSGVQVTVLQMLDISDWVKEEQKYRKLSGLKDAMITIGQAIMTVSDMVDFYDLVLASTMGAMEWASLGTVFLVDEEQTLKPAARRGFGKHSPRFISSHDLFYYELLTKRAVHGTLIINDLNQLRESHHSPLPQDSSRTEILSSLIAPITIEGTLFGFLCIESKQHNAFTEDDRSAMDFFRGQIPIAINHMNRFSEMKHISLHDTLTGVFNRGQMERLFDKGPSHHQRRGDFLSLALLDVNGLKDINDHLGHLAGDTLLRHFAMALKNIIRKTDSVGRYGGDEFIVFFDKMTAEDVAKKMSDLQNWLNKHPFPFEEHIIRCNFSWGIAVFPSDGKDFPTLVAQADGRMYEMKRKMKGIKESEVQRPKSLARSKDKGERK